MSLEGGFRQRALHPSVRRAPLKPSRNLDATFSVVSLHPDNTPLPEHPS